MSGANVQKPSVVGYIVSAIILFVVIIGSSIHFITLFLSITKAHCQIKSPCTQEILLEKKGNYNLFYEHRSIYAGNFYDTPLSLYKEYEISLRKKEGGNVNLIPSVVSSTYNYNDKRIGFSIFSFEISEPGNYVLEATPLKPNDSQPIILSISRSLFETVINPLICMATYSIVGVIVSLIIFVRTFMKRMKANQKQIKC